MAIFLVLFFPLLYFLTVTTSAYEAAHLAVLSSEKVTSTTGPISAIRFRFWSGFSVVDGTGGSAHFTFSVRGSNRAGVADIRLQNRAGRWEVVTITTD